MASYESEKLNLSPGQVIILFSDGVVEAESQSGEQFELDRLKDLVLSCHSEPAASMIETIFSTVDAFSPTQTAADDTTVVVIRRKPE